MALPGHGPARLLQGLGDRLFVPGGKEHFQLFVPVAGVRPQRQHAETLLMAHMVVSQPRQRKIGDDAPELRR
jgi:hypothetical protein